MGDGIAHLDFGGRLDAGDDVAHIAAADAVSRFELHLEDADFIGFVLLAGIEELDLVSFADGPVENLEISDDAAEGVEHGIEDEGLERRLGIALRGGNLLHDGIQQRRDTLAGAGGNLVDILRIAAEQVADLVGHDIHHGGIHVDLVQDRNDLQTMVHRLVEVGNRLGLHALGGVYDQQRPFAGSNAAGDFITEVDMAGGIDQVERILLALIQILHLDRMALDRDALLLLQVHVVEDLVLHVPGRKGLGQFQQPVRQGTLAVVDMRDDAEIADVLHARFNSLVNRKDTSFSEIFSYICFWGRSDRPR